MMLNNNQQKILTEFVKNILNESANWDGPEGLTLAGINEQAAICYGILKLGDYKVGHPYGVVKNN